MMSCIDVFKEKYPTCKKSTKGGVEFYEYEGVNIYSEYGFYWVKQPKSSKNKHYKFHLSIDKNDLDKAIHFLLPLLIEQGVNFKITNLTSREGRPTFDNWRVCHGTQFTIYLPTTFTEQKEKALLAEVEEKLTQENIKPGVMPYTDEPLNQYASFRFDEATVANKPVVFESKDLAPGEFNPMKEAHSFEELIKDLDKEKIKISQQEALDRAKTSLPKDEKRHMHLLEKSSKTIRHAKAYEENYQLLALIVTYPELKTDAKANTLQKLLDKFVEETLKLNINDIEAMFLKLYLSCKKEQVSELTDLLIIARDKVLSARFEKMQQKKYEINTIDVVKIDTSRQEIKDVLLYECIYNNKMFNKLEYHIKSKSEILMTHFVPAESGFLKENGHLAPSMESTTDKKIIYLPLAQANHFLNMRKKMQAYRDEVELYQTLTPPFEEILNDINNEPNIKNYDDFKAACQLIENLRKSTSNQANIDAVTQIAEVHAAIDKKLKPTLELLRGLKTEPANEYFTCKYQLDILLAKTILTQQEIASKIFVENLKADIKTREWCVGPQWKKRFFLDAESNPKRIPTHVRLQLDEIEKAENKEITYAQAEINIIAIGQRASSRNGFCRKPSTHTYYSIFYQETDLQKYRQVNFDPNAKKNLQI